MLTSAIPAAPASAYGLQVRPCSAGFAGGAGWRAREVSFSGVRAVAMMSVRSPSFPASRDGTVSSVPGPGAEGEDGRGPRVCAHTRGNTTTVSPEDGGGESAVVRTWGAAFGGA